MNSEAPFFNCVTFHRDFPLGHSSFPFISEHLSLLLSVSFSKPFFVLDDLRGVILYILFNNFHLQGTARSRIVIYQRNLEQMKVFSTENTFLDFYRKHWFASNKTFMFSA